MHGNRAALSIALNLHFRALEANCSGLEALVAEALGKAPEGEDSIVYISFALSVF